MADTETASAGEARPALAGSARPEAVNCDRAAWRRMIADQWRASVDAIVQVGRLLTDAKAALPHGEFGTLIERELPFSARTAERLMRIASDPRLSNPTTLSLLPPHWGTLYELTKLSDPMFKRLIDEAVICPELTYAAAASLAQLSDDRPAPPRKAHAAAIWVPPADPAIKLDADGRRRLEEIRSAWRNAEPPEREIFAGDDLSRWAGRPITIDGEAEVVLTGAPAADRSDGEVSVSRAKKLNKARKGVAGETKKKPRSRVKKARPVERIAHDVLDMFMADGRSLSVAEGDALAELEREHQLEVVNAMRSGKVPTVLAAIKMVQFDNKIVPAPAILMRTSSNTSPENGMQPSPAAVDVAQAEPSSPAAAVAPHEPAAELIGPAEARASLAEDVRAAVAAGNGLSALCTAWLGAPLINRITFLGGLGLTQAAAELLAERPISIGGERVLAITGVAEETKPLTIEGGVGAEPESGGAPPNLDQSEEASHG